MKGLRAHLTPALALLLLVHLMPAACPRPASATLVHSRDRQVGGLGMGPAGILIRMRSMCNRSRGDLQALKGSGRPSSVLEVGWEGLRGLDGRAAAAAARVLGARWPASRWPIHVFTAGAITCMLTSSVCHLLGCCSVHISQARALLPYDPLFLLVRASRRL
jgi:hypothetical protein